MFDDANGQTLTDHRAQFLPTVQESPLYGSQTQFRAGRGNVKCGRTFNVVATYSGPDTALQGIATMESLIDQKMHLKVTQSSVSVYFPNAIISGLSYDQKGASIMFAVSFTSDPITNNAV